MNLRASIEGKDPVAVLSALVEENVAAMHNIDQLASKTPGLAAICSTVAMVRGYTDVYSDWSITIRRLTTFWAGLYRVSLQGAPVSSGGFGL